MNKMILTISVATIFGLVACNSEKSTMDNSKHGNKKTHVKETSESMTENAVVYYTCPMETHKHIYSVEQGKCEVCGMDLVSVVKGTEEHKDYYGCPMAEHSHVRSDEPGTCAECGMALVPLKFSK
jgi:hypothetical protein